MIIGLTGSIASGKSTVSKILKEKGFVIYDADIIAKEIRDSDVNREKILEIFGEKILKNDGSYDNVLMRKIVFENKDVLRRLNSLIHSQVIDYYQKIADNSQEKKIVFDVPLLFETGIDKICDLVLVIAVDEEIQIKRIAQRDGSNVELAKKIINSQISQSDKIARGDYVIFNNGSLEELENNIDIFLEKIRIKEGK